MAKWSKGEIPGDWSNTDEVKELTPIRNAIDKWVDDHKDEVPSVVKEAVEEAASYLQEAADGMVGPYEPPSENTATTDENAATTEESEK